jgi:hypothetical protein
MASKYLKKVRGEEMVAYVARPEGEAAAGVPLLRLLPADLAVLNNLRASANQRQADSQPIRGDSQIRDAKRRPLIFNLSETEYLTS